VGNQKRWKLLRGEGLGKESSHRFTAGQDYNGVVPRTKIAKKETQWTLKGGKKEVPLFQELKRPHF